MTNKICFYLIVEPQDKELLKMSNVPKKKLEEVTFVTMDAKDLNKVCRRINELLNSRAQKAWEKQKKRPTQKSQENHIEASKDAFAFVHLMEIVEHMTHEIHDLRMELAIVADDDDDDNITSIVSQPRKRKYLN